MEIRKRDILVLGIEVTLLLESIFRYHKMIQLLLFRIYDNKVDMRR